jgi:PrtD family type I secretion system ABC transporter
MRTSRRMLKQVRRALFAAFLFSGCINVLMLATPLYTLQVFETVVPLGSIETLVLLTLIAGAAILTLSAIEIARDMILLRASLWLDHELGQYILENGIRLGISGAELRQDAHALERFRGFLASSGVTPLFDAPWIPIFVIALFALHPLIGVASIACVILLGAAAVLQSLLTRRLELERARAAERTQQWWSAIANNAQFAGALGLAKGAAAQWETFNRSHVSSAYSIGKRSSIIRSLSRQVRIGSQIGLYALGAWLVVKGELAPGALVAAAILMARALAPLENLVGSIKALQSAWAAYARLKALPADATVPRVGPADTLPRGKLELRDATFYHAGRKTPALRSVTFSIEPGRCLGIVGPNGSGKSTLAGIMAGALIPTSGAADLDGIPVAKWQRGETLPPVGYLPDEPSLIDGTVHENIARFGDASVMTVANAALKAGVHEILQSLPQGYDTPAGSGGSGLAIRERRAVAFARAVFGNPRLIVLDEPEIGLDGAGLRRLVNVLAELKASGFGLVLATQDPRLLQLTDDVVVLNEGAVQAFGPSIEVKQRIDAKRAATAPATAGLH